MLSLLKNTSSLSFSSPLLSSLKRQTKIESSTISNTVIQKCSASVFNHFNQAPSRSYCYFHSRKFSLKKLENSFGISTVSKVFQNKTVVFLNPHGFVCDSESELKEWSARIEEIVKLEFSRIGHNDGSHDISHLQRVAKLSLKFANSEGANPLIVITASLLHDIVNLPKNHPKEKNSSFLAAERARELLAPINFPNKLIEPVADAILTHSYSAKIDTQTSENLCLKEADKIDALGAIGIMRLFYVSGRMGTQLMHEKDPAGRDRELNDKQYALDHFEKKLFKLYHSMKLTSAQTIAKPLTHFMEDFRIGLIENHLDGNQTSGFLLIAKTFQKAGQMHLSLFHPTDPFAKKGRALDFKYALDQVLLFEDPDVHQFLEQLKFELNGYQ